MVEQARRFVQQPPTAMEEIGFYGLETAPPRTRAFLATVSLLDNGQFIQSVEDKYLLEIFERWRDAGVIDRSTLPAAASAVFGPVLDGELYAIGEDKAAFDRFVETLRVGYAQATRELEEHIAARGSQLLSIDATDGDTMFFALVDKTTADKWRDRTLSEHEGRRAGVRSPMWDRFWTLLAYALGLPPDASSLPPGTRTQVEAIPFAE